MKKIVVISEFVGGGVEKVNMLLTEYLDKNKYEVIILSIKGNGKKFAKDINYISLDMSSGKKAIFKIIYNLKKIKPDIILTNNHTDTFCSLLYTKIINRTAKSIFTLHSVYSSMFSYNKNRKLIFSHYIPRILNLYGMCDGIIYVSKGVKKDFYKYFKIKDKKEKVIYNPVIENLDMPIRNKKIENKLKLITVGRLSKEKNQKFLIDVVHRLVAQNINCELNIVGKGEMEDSLKEYVFKLGLTENINFKGFKKNVNNELIDNDVFVLASEYESFGNVIVEAMNSKILVVSTNCFCGPYEIIGENQFGFLSEKNNVNQFCDILVKAYNEYPDYIVEAAYNESEKYYVKTKLDEYSDFFDKLVGEI